MHSIVRGILAVVLGFVGGSALNMGTLHLGFALFPVKGHDPINMNDMAEILPLLDYHYFLFPFLTAHVLGTLVGACICAAIVKNHKMKFAMGFGVLSLVGGTIACIVIPAPTWYIITDLALAYIPMAWLGGKLAIKMTNK